MIRFVGSVGCSAPGPSRRTDRLPKRRVGDRLVEGATKRGGGGGASRRTFNARRPTHRSPIDPRPLESGPNPDGAPISEREVGSAPAARPRPTAGWRALDRGPPPLPRPPGGRTCPCDGERLRRRAPAHCCRPCSLGHVSALGWGYRRGR